MKVAFYIEKKELDWSYGRLFQNWAESLSFDIISRISDLKNDYHFIISDDILSIKISSIMPELTSTIVPYVQTLFGLNMLRSGKKGIKRRLGSFLPLYITSKRYKEAMKSFNIILSNSLGTSSLLHHLYNISANYIVYPGVDSKKFKPVSRKKIKF